VTGQLVTPAGVNDGSQALAAATHTQFAEPTTMMSDIAHYVYSMPIKNSVIARVESCQQKAGSVYEWIFEVLMQSYTDKIASSAAAWS
jgi:adenylosuccinate lyase